MSAEISPVKGHWWRDAPALRFLALFLLAWVGLRAAEPMVGTLWSGPNLAEPDSPPPTLIAEAVKSVRQVLVGPDGGTIADFSAAPAAPDEAIGNDQGKRRLAAGWDSPTFLTPPSMLAVPTGPNAASDAAPTTKPTTNGMWGAVIRAEPRVVDQPPVQNSTSSVADHSAQGAVGWSLSTWLFLRGNLARASGNLPVAGELGGSQAGLRLAYALDKRGRVDVYGRMSAALGSLQQSEAALGVSAAPFADVPIRVAVERRQKLGRDGRSAMAAMVVGGVSGKAMPLGFRLDAYGQAGVVGVNSRDAFIDGSVVVDRAINREKDARSLRFGVVVAGAAQPDVARVDVGPRLTLPLPQLGKGARIAVDWRHRVAGNAEPKNGATLTFGADF